MNYKTEHISDITSSQNLISELFSYIGEHFEQSAQLRENWGGAFFRVWADQDPYSKIRVFTARDDNGKLQGVVMALLIANPLFVTKPFIEKFVDLTNNDQAFENYVKIVLESL